MSEKKNTKSKLTRRKFIGGLAVLGGGALVAPKIIGSNLITSMGAVSKPLTIGYIPILDCVPLIVGYQMGFFKEFGIKSKKPALIRGWPALMEAFTSKQILLSHILLPQVVFMRYKQDVPVRSIAFNHTNVVAMLTAKDITSVRDLGGKMVGCPTWWAPHTGIYQDVISKAGLTPVAGKKTEDLQPNEVGFRIIPPPDMVEGLKSGKIAGCTVSEPFGAGAEVLAEATMVKMSGDVWREHPCCQSVMLQETIDHDRPWSEAVVKAIYKSALWAKDNREELAEILGKDGGGYFPMPIKIIKRALLKNDLETYGHHGTGAIMHDHWHVERVGFEPYPRQSAFEVTLDMMKRMVVPQSAALPEKFRTLSSKKVADEIVHYDLVDIGMKAAKGTNTFEGKEQYEVLIK